MTVFVPEQFVHTELLFYKGTQNQGKSGLDKNQVSDKIIQDIQVPYRLQYTRKDNTYRFHCSFICLASSLQYEGPAGIRSGYTVGVSQTDTSLAESSIIKVNCTCKATCEL